MAMFLVRVVLESMSHRTCDLTADTTVPIMNFSDETLDVLTNTDARPFYPLNNTLGNKSGDTLQNIQLVN